MSDSVTITTTHDTPLFDPEDHRRAAAEQLSVTALDSIHCVSTGPDGFDTISDAIYSEDGTLLKSRVVSFTRVTAWAAKPATVAAEPDPAPPVVPPLVHHIPKLSRGARWHGIIDGIEGYYISTGSQFVLLDSADGLAMLSALHSEEVGNKTGTGG